MKVCPMSYFQEAMQLQTRQQRYVKAWSFVLHLIFMQFFENEFAVRSAVIRMYGKKMDKPI